MRGTGDLPGATFHQSQRLLLHPRPSCLVTLYEDFQVSVFKQLGEAGEHAGSEDSRKFR